MQPTSPSDPGNYRSPLELPVVPLPNAALPHYHSPLEAVAAMPSGQPGYASPLDMGGYASPLEAGAAAPRPVATLSAPPRMAPAPIPVSLAAVPSAPLLLEDDDLTAVLRANRRRTWLLGLGMLFLLSAFVGAMIALQGG